MIKWKTDNNISSTQKKGPTSNNSNRSRSEERKKLKNRISGNKKAKFHVIDEELYQKIRLSFGFNPNFHLHLDAAVAIFVAILICRERYLE